MSSPRPKELRRRPKPPSWRRSPTEDERPRKSLPKTLNAEWLTKSDSSWQAASALILSDRMGGWPNRDSLEEKRRRLSLSAEASRLSDFPKSPG
jgi:hypothetical protein